VTIDPHGHQQEPLFPTSNEERIQLQEALLDLLADLARAEEQMKVDTATARGKIAELKKRVMKLEELLRMSRPGRPGRTP
jgi:hypothetical protein